MSELQVSKKLILMQVDFLLEGGKGFHHHSRHEMSELGDVDHIPATEILKLRVLQQPLPFPQGDLLCEFEPPTQRLHSIVPNLYHHLGSWWQNTFRLTPK